MTGPTHKQYSILFACITLMIMFNTSISEINYYLNIPIVMAISKYGALFPDIDHEWKNVGNKTVLNRVLNFLIRHTGGKHRSRHTHSLDICLIFTILSCILPKHLCDIGYISSINREVMILISISFASGWISHLFSDLLTIGGIRILFWQRKVVKIVPKQIGKMKFNTGGEWEKFNYKFIKVTNKIIGVICLIYPILYNYKEMIYT